MEISVREDRRQMLMNMLLIERVYVALEYHGISYNDLSYLATSLHVREKIKELRDLCKEHKLVITERLLNHAIKYGANNVTLEVNYET